MMFLTCCECKKMHPTIAIDLNNLAMIGREWLRDAIEQGHDPYKVGINLGILNEDGCINAEGIRLAALEERE